MEYQNAQTIVLDTSFLKGYADGQFWTTVTYHRLQEPGVRVVIPQGVEQEFRGLMHGVKQEFGQGDDEVQRIQQSLGIKDAISYTNRLRHALSSKLEERIMWGGKEHTALDYTDKTVVQAALELAHSGKVVVSSADRGIVAQVYEFKDRDDLDIQVDSLWSVPQQHDDIEMLVTENVMEELRAVRNNMAYLAVARNMHIGGQAKYDIAAAVWVNRDNAIVKPDVDGDLVRIFRVLKLGDKYQQSGADYLNMIASDKIITAFDRRPYLVISKVLNPITPKEKRRLMPVLIRQGKLQPRDERLLRVVNLSTVFWNWINDKQITDYDPTTVGVLQKIRKQVA